MHYRKEIDGLRAIAVIPVILYHAGFAAISGGFVGVDVFFVISGYLITSILLADLARGRFSIIDFYERRARRILPALFLVMLVSLIAAWWWLPTKDMKTFSNSLVAVSVFASNILFRITTNYFDAASELNPLIHTWSLAVEEQYYIFFPLLLWGLWRYARPYVLPVLGLIMLISLGWAHTQVIQNPVVTFFLLPSRIWELLCGAIAAYWLFRKQSLPTLAGQQVLSLLGLSMIIGSMLLFTVATPTPSGATLLPVLGATMIVLFAQEQTWVARLLGHSWLVGIGLISYSAYLWHQPLLAFSRQIMMQELSQTGTLAIMTASLLLAYFSWKYVEAPFRNRQWISRTQIFVFSILGAGFFITVGLAGHFTKGFEFRLSPEKAAFLDYYENSMPAMRYFQRVGIPQAYRIQCDFYDIEKSKLGASTRVPVATIAQECYVRDTSKAHRLMIWGDSHAQHLYGGIRQHLPAEWQILQVASSGCEPKLAAQKNNEDYCETSNWFAWKTILENQPEVVVIAQNKNQQPALMERITKALTQAGVQQVLMVGPTPHWRRDLPNLVVYWLWEHTPARTWFGVEQSIVQEDKRLQSAVSQIPHLQYLSMTQTLCQRSGCLVYLGDDVKTGLTTWDYGHLSPMASAYFAEQTLVPAVLNTQHREASANAP